MAPVLSLPMGLHRNKKLVGLSVLLTYILVRRQQTRAKRQARQQRQAAAAGERQARGGQQGNKTRRVGVDRHFLEQLKKLLPICIPGM